MGQMYDLEKRITGDWVQLKENATDLYTLLDFMKISGQELKNQCEKLRLSVEQGAVEHKRSSIASVFTTLEAVKYKSLNLEELQKEEHNLTLVLLSVLVQRLLAIGTIAFKREQEEKRSFLTEGMDINAIVTEVKDRAGKNPDFKSHPAVKKIFMQVHLYHQESAKMKELLPTIKPEKRSLFMKNFSNTFEVIFSSIRKSYAEILKEDLSREEAKKPAFSMASIPLKELIPLFTAQAQEFSLIRSSVSFARDEKYKTREILVSLYERRAKAFQLIEKELKLYRQICKQAMKLPTDECALSLTRGFRDELIVIYERQSKWEREAGS